MKPHLVIKHPQRTPLQEVHDRYGEAFRLGEGPRVWTAERVAQLAAENEKHRQQRNH